MMRKDLKKTAGVMAMVKNPNFPPVSGNEMEASTTSVEKGPKNVVGGTLIPNVAKEKYDPKSQTFKPSVMYKDLKALVFGKQTRLPDNPIPRPGMKVIKVN